MLQGLFNHLREAHARQDVKAIVVMGAGGACRPLLPPPLLPLQPLRRLRCGCPCHLFQHGLLITVPLPAPPLPASLPRRPLLRRV